MSAVTRGPWADAGKIDLSEDGIALEFAQRHEGTLRYCHARGALYQWTGTHWQIDQTSLAFAWSRDLCRAVNTKGSAKLKKISTASAVERAARADQRLAVTSDLWDRDAWLLGTPGGTVDLRTGELRAARPQEQYDTEPASSL